MVLVLGRAVDDDHQLVVRLRLVADHVRGHVHGAVTGLRGEGDGGPVTQPEHPDLGHHREGQAGHQTDGAHQQQHLGVGPDAVEQTAGDGHDDKEHCDDRDALVVAEEAAHLAVGRGQAGEGSEDEAHPGHSPAAGVSVPLADVVSVSSASEPSSPSASGSSDRGR